MRDVTSPLHGITTYNNYVIIFNSNAVYIQILNAQNYIIQKSYAVSVIKPTEILCKKLSCLYLQKSYAKIFLSCA